MTLKPLYVVGLVYVAFAGSLALSRPFRPQPVTGTHGTPDPVPFKGPASAWFSEIRPYCNSVEVETRHRWSPPPATEQGIGYSAACYALAGKVDHARELIMEVDAADRWRAAGIVFNVAHPVADAGDDLSAGPIMELVVEFWPNHYMALYHAGISNYELGHHDRARKYLQDFLEHYDQDDGWRQNAVTVLGRLAG